MRIERPTPRPARAVPPALPQGVSNAALARYLARSARFGNDPGLRQVGEGADELTRGERGLDVTKTQQALADAGYPVRVSGVYDDATERAVARFQQERGLAPSGRLDQATIAALDELYNTRRPYIDNARLDPANPDKGERRLTDAEKAAVGDAMLPSRGARGTFADDVDGAKYGDDIRARLTAVIDKIHKEDFEGKATRRMNPKNLHDWSALEGAAAASQKVVLDLYGSYIAGKPPAMTHARATLVDTWDEELARDAQLGPEAKVAKARDLVWYLVTNMCAEVNDKHSAIPSAPQEKAILTPVVESFLDSLEKVVKLLELDISWGGMQGGGVVYVQRNKDDDEHKNRLQMWHLFHTCIHEYLHGCAHGRFRAHAENLYRAGDGTRYNTLIEGFCDFFTQNVRQTIRLDADLRAQVEGPYHDPATPPPVLDPGTYPSIAQAEQVVSIVGIRNAEAAYFQGEVDRIGAA